MIPISEFVKSRFWNRVKKGSLESCWEWQGGRLISGYGMVSTGPKGHQKKFRANRVAYELAYGEIPDGMMVCHRCDNPPCCNPAHLFLGTHKDNAEDAKHKGRLNLSGLELGDRFMPGEQHRDSKLKAEDVRAIRRAYSGERGDLSRLARQYGVAAGTIHSVVNGKTWQFV